MNPEENMESVDSESSVPSVEAAAAAEESDLNADIGDGIGEGAPGDTVSAVEAEAAAAQLPKPSELTVEQLIPIVEAILFAADRPVSVDRFRAVVAPKPEDDPGPAPELFEQAIEALRLRCETPEVGFVLRKAHGGYQFVTKAPFAEYIRRYQASKPFRLGRAAMETLAIIAYKQPITRAEIDQVRGMDSSHLMRTLIERGMIRMAGKAEVPGRPVLYATTPRFLEVLGLNSLNDLPPLSELKQLEGDVEDPARKMEEGLDRFMQPDPYATAIPVGDSGEPIDAGLMEIETLIGSAGKPQEEVYESALHKEIALENQAALEAFQASTPRRRKKTLTYEEITGAPAAPVSGEAPAESAADSVADKVDSIESGEPQGPTGNA